MRDLFLMVGVFGASFSAVLLGQSNPRRIEDVKTIVILGDSISAGYGVESSQAFPAELQRRIDELKLPYAIVNAGVSGDTTAGGLRRINWVLKRPAEILIIELGGNDGLRGISPGETEKNLAGIIERARERHSEIQILLAGMQMPQNMGADYTSQFRGIFPRIARDKNVSLVPFLLEGVGGEPELNQPDLIHPNEKGHKIVADNVWRVLMEMLGDIREKP